jgi:signal transduction histidine kinase
MMLRLRTQPSLSRDFTLLSLFIVFVLLLVSLWVAYQTQAENGERILRQLENESLRIDRALIVEVENASYILESVGRQIAAMGEPELARIDPLFQSFDRRDYAKNSFFSWIDPQNQLVASSVTGILKQPLDVSDRDYIKKAVTTPWKLYIGRPVEGRISKRWVLPLSLGVTNKQGEYLGVLVLSLDIASLTREIDKVIKEQGISFAITNLSLTLLTEESEDANFFAKRFDLKKLSAIDFDSAPTGVFSKPGLWSWDTIYSYYERSGQYPYVIFLGYDSKRSVESIRNVLIPRLFQLCIIACFLLFVLWTVRRRIIQPVIRLTDIIAAIARGQPFIPLEEPGPLEIEQMQIELERLSQYLEERRRLEAELRTKNRELLKIKQAAHLANEVKAEFYTQVGEQLQEPLALIRDQAETLKDQHFGPLGSPKYVQNAGEILTLSEQVLHVLRDIRAITENESNLMLMADVEIDLTFVTQKIVRAYKEKEGQNFDIQIDYPSTLPAVRADELRFRQLLTTLLEESARTLSPGDLIRISAADKGDEMHIIFSYGTEEPDAGRRNATPSRGMARTPRTQGLGMAFARLLVSIHQGQLETRSLPDKTFQILIRWPEGRLVRG